MNSPPEVADLPDLRSRAWALKDQCYQAWTRDPAAALLASSQLQDLLSAGVPIDQSAEVQALAHWTQGIARLLQGQMAQAVRCFDQAGAGLASLGLADAAAQTQVPKIMALSMLGQHDEAAACGQAAQQALRALGNLGAAARVSQNLGSMQMHRDHYAQAARHYREAAVLFARQGEHAQSVLADIGLGDTLAAQGEFDESLHIYARARMRAGTQGLEPMLALVDESVALVHLARGHYRAALAGLEAARRRYQALALPQQEAVAEKQLADVYLELRLLPEALALFDTAVTHFQGLHMPDEEAWALAQQGRARALLGQSAATESFAAAQALFAQQGHAVGQAAVALARAELALTRGHGQEGLTLASAAANGFQHAAQMDGYARSQVVRAQALLQLGQVRQAGLVFDDTLRASLALQQLAVQVRCHTGQGLVARAQGDEVAALAQFEAAIELFEDQRRALPGEELRSAFLGEHLRPYEERLRQALASGDAAATLVQLDRFRARALEGADAAAASPVDDASIGVLRERLTWLTRRLQRDDEAPSAALTLEFRDTESRLLEQARRQRLLLAALPAAGRADGLLDTQALMAALQDGDALVEYGAVDDELLACVVTRQSVTLVRSLASWTQVQQALRSARFQIETLSHGAPHLQAHLPTLSARAQARLAQLSRLVWAPLQAPLAQAQRVLVVPHGVLAALPFAALPLAQGPLGEQLELAQVASARAALRGLARPALPARAVLALGESTRLPHAAQEAQMVAELFAQGQALVGEAATLHKLHQHAACADVLHLACHAQFRSDNPRFSALQLHDAPLTVEGVEALRLKACTVVLSACESALAENSLGNDHVGLVRAFMAAGAARVVASLWPVDDAVAAFFMGHFYRALVQGRSPAQALGAAQMATREVHSHPYFWGAFTLNGGW